MVADAVLVLYAVLVAVLAPRFLSGAGWARRSPRLGVLAWQACVGAVLGAVVLLATTALSPTGAVLVDLGRLLHTCTQRLLRPGRPAPAAFLSAAAVLVAVLALCRFVWVLVVLTRSVGRERGRQRQLLRVLVARADDDGAFLLDTEAPLAYCIPGGGGRVVLTTGAARLLTPQQRVAVLAHEREHLRARHGLVLLLADAASTAFGFVRVFPAAPLEIRALVEMVADDAAVRAAGTLHVAAALVGLGVRQPPPTTVAANGSAVADRVERLLRGTPALPLPGRCALALASVLVLAVPWAVSAGTLVAAARGLCLPGP